MTDVITLVPDDSSADARAANKLQFQSAADYVINAGRQKLKIATSGGVIDCDPGIYIDPPGNLRVNPSSPSIFNFSFDLDGVGGIGNHEGHGTQLRFLDNSQPAIIVGTGHGLRFGGFSVLGPGGASSRAALPEGGVGIALAGGAGGLHRCCFDGVMVEGFRSGIKTSYNNVNALCDSVTLNDSKIAGCYRGLDVNQSNNLIVNVNDCTLGDNTHPIWSTPGNAINIRGGNYSTTFAHAKAFAISGVSALSVFTDGFAGNSFTNWTFTATIALPDQPLADGADGAYDAFCIVTSRFGVVPLQRTAYNAGTGVITLKFYPGWLKSQYFSFANLKTDTEIEADLQAATTLYACETVTVFRGTGINADGVHVENPGVLTRLIDASVDFGGETLASLRHIHANYLINHGNLAAAESEDQKAVFYCQQVFPFIRLVNGGLVLSDSPKLDSKEATQDGVVIELWSNSSYDLKVSNCNLARPNLYLPLRSLINPDNGAWPSMVRGAGLWDSTPFVPVSGTPYTTFPYINNVPFEGFAPASWATPRLKPAQLTAIEAGPGSLGTYPLLHGEAIYKVIDDTSGPSAALFARSAHHFWSYGQNLSINWSFKGISPVLKLSDTSRMLAGLQVTLDNSEDGDLSYVVTGVYPTLGYCTATCVSGRYGTSNETGPLYGSKVATYAGNTVKQEPYSLKTVSGV